VANDNGKPNVDTLVDITHFQPLGDVRKYYEKETHILSKVAACIMVQLLEALKYLHGLGILHCSVRLENLNIASKEPLRIVLTALKPQLFKEKY